MDAIYVNMSQQLEVDIDEQFGIALIREVKYEPEGNIFYVLSNKKGDLLGLYFVEINADDPSDYKYILNWRNKLDIGDTNIFVVKNEKYNYKELSISFKNIFINTFNVILIDMTSEGNHIMYRHESF